MSQSQIKSSTIMFTDIFGYSKMVEKDEKHALNLLEQHNQIITDSIKKFDGSVVKFIGDAVFAEFSKPTNASNCAIQIQQNFIQRNKIHAKNDRIQIRIGLHMGDLVVKGDDLLGNTVNLGSRIESAAPVDGILISKPVFDSIQEDTKYFTKEIGFVKLKNIKDPCQLYKLYLDQLSFTAQSENDLEKETLDRGVQIIDMENYSPIDIYSIGIKYFANLGNVADEMEYRGIAQEIIKTMSKINAIRIPSASEIDQYKDTNLPISEIARRMQVDYMLLGSIVKKDETYTLNLEMKNITADEHCFEGTFSFKSMELNETIGQILMKILPHFDLEIPEQLEKHFQMQPTLNSQAMDHYIKGRHLMEVPKSQNSLDVARDHFEEATKLDPSFLYAHTNKGWISLLNGDYDTAEEEFYSALDLARQDNFDISDAYVYGYMGTLYNRLEKYPKSIHYLEKALEIYLKYNDKRAIASQLHNLGHVLNESGKSTEALDCFKRSLVIKEEFEDINLLASSYNQIADAYYMKGDYSLAIEHANRSIGYYNSLGNRLFCAYSMIILADSLTQIGYFSESEVQLNLAQEVLEEFNNLFLLGKVDVLRGIKYFNEGDIEQSIYFYEEGMEKMQLGDAKRRILNYSMELLHVLVNGKDFSRSSKYLKRSQLLLKKMADVGPDKTLLDTIESYISISTDGKEHEKIDSLYKQAQIERDPHYLSFYYLGKSFEKIDNMSKKKECMNKAQDLLDIIAHNISDSSHRDSFKTTHLIHQEIFR